MINSFSPEDLQLLVKYTDTEHLLQILDASVLGPAEERASRIAAGLKQAEALLLGG
jgi:hypothetical protein